MKNAVPQTNVTNVFNVLKFLGPYFMYTTQTEAHLITNTRLMTSFRGQPG